MKTEEVIQQIKDDVAAQLRAMRAFRNETLKEVAKAAGVGPSRLSQIEHGKANVRIGTLGKIAASLECRFTFHIVAQLVAQQKK